MERFFKNARLPRNSFPLFFNEKMVIHMKGSRQNRRNENIKTICLNCEKAKVDTNYYINFHSFIKLDKFPVCKNCLNSYIEEAADDNEYMDRIRVILAILNRPFINDLWNELGRDWRKYIRTISSFPQYSNLTFRDSDFFNEKNDIQYTSLSDDDNILDEYDIGELERFWGKGISIEDLHYLQNEYDKLINSYECDTYAMEMLFQEISHLRLTIKKKRLKGESVDKELKTLQDLLGSANVKPVQETGANAAEQATFGTLIKKWENERPIPEPDEEWKDVDGISKYVKTWFFGQLTRILGMRGEHTQEFEEELEKYTVKPPQYEEGED